MSDERPKLRPRTGALAERRPRARPTDYRASLERMQQGAPEARLDVPGDPAGALLDAAAVLSEVLAFYEARFGPESYLATAQEPRSLLELSRHVHETPAPGAAARAWLTLRVEERGEGPAELTLPARQAVLSRPPPGGAPQTFETHAPKRLSRARNELRCLSQRPAHHALVLQGGALVLSLLELEVALPEDASLIEVPTDDVASQVYALNAETLAALQRHAARGLPLRAMPLGLLHLAPGAKPPSPGEPILLVGQSLSGAKPGWQLRVRSVEPLEGGGHALRVDDAALPPASPAELPWGDADDPTPAFNRAEVAEQIAGKTWTHAALRRWLRRAGWDEAEVNAMLRTPPAPRADLGVFRFQHHEPLFGHQAPAFESLDVKAREGRDDWDQDPHHLIWSLNQTGGLVHAARAIEDVAPGSFALLTEASRSLSDWLLLKVESATPVTLAGFNLSGPATAVQLVEPRSAIAPQRPALTRRGARLHLNPVALPLQALPIGEAVCGPQLTLDRLLTELDPGDPIVLSGELADAPGVQRAEVLTVVACTHHAGRTQVTVAEPTERYRPETARVAANVVEVSHGATVEEVLGSGHSATANQRFRLSHAPLTTLATPEGRESSLEVFVDGLRWRAVDSLLTQGPEDRVFEVRPGADGHMRITFGDGARGARLPTGQGNVRARYRHGAGAEGLVAANTLRILRAPPPGVKGADNPLPAVGADDPEPQELTRARLARALLHVDRVVSTSDHEAFALRFPGVGKVRVDTFFAPELARGDADGPQEVVEHIVLSVATPAGAPLDDGTCARLREALQAARLRGPSLLVQGVEEQRFQLSARLSVRGDVPDAAEVVERAEAALRARFHASARRIAQGVTATEVIAALQAVDGVDAVDLDVLCPAGASPSRALELQGAAAGWDPVSGAWTRATLLSLHPQGLSLREWTHG